MDTKNNSGKAIINTSNKAKAGKNKPQSVEHSLRNKNISPAAKAAPRGRTAEPLVIETKKKDKKPLPIGSIFTIAVTTLLFIFLLMNYAEIDNYNSEIASLKDELTELQKSAEKLSQRLDRKNNLIYFEDYAVNELGMVKSSELTRINITTLPENTGAAFRYDDYERGGFGLLLSGFGEVLKNFFD